MASLGTSSRQQIEFEFRAKDVLKFVNVRLCNNGWDDLHVLTVLENSFYALYTNLFLAYCQLVGFLDLANVVKL